MGLPFEGDYLCRQYFTLEGVKEIELEIKPVVNSTRHTVPTSDCTQLVYTELSVYLHFMKPLAFYIFTIFSQWAYPLLMIMQTAFYFQGSRKDDA